MSISLSWYLNAGMKFHDQRTTENVLQDEFISHAKSEADAEEIKLIDRCVKFQRKQLRYHQISGDALCEFKAGRITFAEWNRRQSDAVMELECSIL